MGDTPSLPNSKIEAEDRHANFYDARVNLPACRYNQLPKNGCTGVTHGRGEHLVLVAGRVEADPEPVAVPGPGRGLVNSEGVAVVQLAAL